jgi:hypothetical protein
MVEQLKKCHVVSLELLDNQVEQVILGTFHKTSFL